MERVTLPEARHFRKKLPRQGGVYGIKCEQTGMWYVGETCDLYKRIYRHLRDIERGYNQHIDEEDLSELTFTAYILGRYENRGKRSRAEANWMVRLNSLYGGYNTAWTTATHYPKGYLDEYKKEFGKRHSRAVTRGIRNARSEQEAAT